MFMRWNRVGHALEPVRSEGGSGIQVRGNKIQTLQNGKRAAVGKNK